jgi:hypothetical protein
LNAELLDDGTMNATIAMNPRPKTAKDRPMKKKSAARKPAAKKPAAKKRTNGSSYPSETALVIAAPRPRRKKRRTNPAFNLQKAAMGLLGLAPGAVVGVGGELGLLTARGEAVAGGVMIAAGAAMIGADILPELGAGMIGAGSVPVAREIYRMATSTGPSMVAPAPVAGIGDDYAPRRGDIVMAPDGRAMIADGRGGYVTPADRPVRAVMAVQGVHGNV